jgi:hypothetical protein
MTKEDATALIIAVNRLQPHVAPLLYEALAQSRVASLAAAVANGVMVCAVTPAPAPDHPEAAVDGKPGA